MSAPTPSAESVVTVERFDNVIQLTWMHPEPLPGRRSGEETPTRQVMPIRWSPRPLRAAGHQLREHADVIGLFLAALFVLIHALIGGTR